MTDRNLPVLPGDLSSDHKPYIVRPETEKFLGELEATLRQDGARLFHVWGVGGVGKTTVLRKARERLAGRVIAADVSFGTTNGIEEPIGLMEALAKELRSDDWGAIDTSEFAKLIKLYRETSFKLENEPAEKGKGLSEEQKTIGQTLANLALGYLQKGMPEEKAKEFDEVGSKMVESAMTNAAAALTLFQKHQATKENKQLQELMQHPTPKLTEAFAKLLRGQGKPVLLVLDTYEKATQEIDIWLCRTLLGNQAVGSEGLGNTRILVAGRNCLTDGREGWRKLKQDQGCVRVLGLDRFDRGETKKYLQESGIQEDGEIERIYGVTKGLPYYLNWIREKVQAGKKPDFSQGNEAIADLLLQGLNVEQRRLIEVAACFRQFRRKNLERVLGHLKDAQGLDVAVAAGEQGAFDWLIDREKMQFVQKREGHYRLDDVARDVFRLSFFEEDEELFRVVQGVIAADYLAEAQKVEPEESGYGDRYQNGDWRKPRAAYLYHLLLSGDKAASLIFRSHLLEARYFGVDDLVREAFNDLVGEFGLENHPILSRKTREFLIQISAAIEHGEFVLDKIPLNYNHVQLKDYSRSHIDLAIQVCLEQPEKLKGLSHFVALLYKAGRCPENSSIQWVQRAMQVAELLAHESADLRFSSGLFTWGVGNRLAELGKYALAIASYDRSLDLCPDFFEAWYNRGIALGELAASEEAQTEDTDELDRLLEEEIRSYQEAVAINPEFDQAWYNLGVAFKDVDLEAALDCYDRALAIQPKKVEAWDSKGIVLKRVGRVEDALKCYEHALSINPEYYQAWYNKGVALGGLGYYEAAIACFEQAVFCNPQYAKAFYNLACVYALEGSSEQSLCNLKKSIQLCPNLYIEKAKLDSDLVSLRSMPEFEKCLYG
jgi:tetratricopeptide (TPR) repeat protein